ncbi:MAG TPA: type II TA system antitoxin MqsA family protein [Candidatus Angelobacter sp.]|nr:type II TA system antitoxin MqsA family protein [Candidatus Angelobacter sp.]
MSKNENWEKDAVRECYECHGEMRGSRQNYCYTECGLSSVILMNILVFHCAKCSAIVPEIPDAGWLHRTIAWDLMQKKTLLTGEEMKLIRRVAGYSATDLASVMGTSKVTMSRWETGAKKISKESDRLFRLICFVQMIQRTVGASPNPTTAGDVVQLARAYKSLHVPALLEALERIQNKAEGPMPVRIDPSNQAGFGEPFSLVTGTEAIQ